VDGETIRIRDVEAPPGTRSQGFLTIGETPSEPIRVPLVIINGRRPGPRLCLTAGVHAAEYPGIDAVLRTIQELDPSALTGAVVAVPVVNPPMFQRRAGFLSPIDGLNLNRTAPTRTRKASPLPASTARASSPSIAPARACRRRPAR
jgi:predicted deacylase